MKNGWEAVIGMEKLGYVEQKRPGLLAEWRFLEEEAHKAGVKIN